MSVCGAKQFKELCNSKTNYLEKGRIIAEALKEGETQVNISLYTGINKSILSNYCNAYRNLESLKKHSQLLYNILLKKAQTDEIKMSLLIELLTSIDEIGYKNVLERFTPDELEKDVAKCLLKTSGFGERRCARCKQVKDYIYFRPKRQKCKSCERIRVGGCLEVFEQGTTNADVPVITEIKKTVAVDEVQNRHEKEIESGLETIEYTLDEINTALDNMESIPSSLAEKILVTYNKIAKVKEKAYDINN